MQTDSGIHYASGFERWPIYSQGSTKPSAQQIEEANKFFLPTLIWAWQQVEKYTGFRWKSTSYWRNSPSHWKGHALDIAPDISPPSQSKYALHKMSDPVLYKRAPLMRALQAITQIDPSTVPVFLRDKVLGYFVESDHIHIHIGDSQEGQIKVYKWKRPKYIYPDTLERMKLPMTSKGYS